jgi:predicted permease
MRWVSRWWRRVTYLLRREREDRELEDELRFHVEMEAEELLRSGLPPGEARRRAAVAFGGVDRYREQVREARGVRWLDDLRQDLGWAVRSLSRARGFTSGTLVVLALGIGATTAIFGVVYAVLLRPLPYPDSDALVRVWLAAPARGSDRVALSVPDFRDLRARGGSLEHLALYTTILSGLVLTGDGPAEEIPTAYVAGDFFGTFGVPAVLGRTLRPDEEADAPRVVVLSHRYWTRRFGADPGLIGSTLTLDQETWEVVGIMPPRFAVPDPEIDAWVFLSVVPQSSAPWEIRGVRFPSAVGRLAPGATVARATDELSATASALAETHPDSNEGLHAATVVPLRESLVGDVRASLWLVLGAVTFILLIACANVAGLLLARGSQRRGEIAVRVSLGAGRERIVRQLLAESLVLGLGGGVLGVGVAVWGTRLFLARAEGLIPRASEIGPDAVMLACAAGLTLLTTALFGLLPALRAGEASPASDLRGETRSASRGPEAVRLRRWLVGAEVAVAVVLLVGATLLVRSLAELRSVDAGFEPEGAAALTLTLVQEKYPTRAEYLAYYRELLAGMRRIPGVEAVGSMRRLPLRGGGERWAFDIPGVYAPAPDEDPDIEGIHVGGDAFRALGIEVVAGRTFGARDDADAPLRIVINRALERRYFQGIPPVGRTLRLGGELEAEVIGVVEDVHHVALAEPPVPTLYLHMEQNARIGMAIVVRTASGVEPASVLAAMRDVVVGVEPDQPVTDLAPVAAVLQASIARPRLVTQLLGGFAGLAALLAALGIYGVIAYTVRQRVREVGLRMALGARAGDVVGLIVRQGMMPALLGLVVGLAGAAAGSRLMESLLFGVEPLDPRSFVAAGAFLAALALAACALPAAWAARLQPAEVLRDG